MVSYCDVKCQKVAWKAGHKAECKRIQEEIANDVPIQVKPELAEGCESKIMNQETRREVAVQTSGSVPTPSSDSTTKIDSKGFFTVKVQKGSFASPIYDRSRTVVLMMHRKHTRFQEMQDLIQQKGVQGQKIYVRARVEQGILMLYTKQVRPAEKW